MTISAEMARAILRQSSDEVAVILLTISGTGFTTFRVCDHDTAITSNGNTFLAFPFKIELPGDGENAPVARLQISNVSRLIGEAIDAATGQIAVKIELVLASDPDNVEKSFDGLELRSVSRDALSVQGELQSAQFTSEPYPQIRAIPSRLPGLFFD